MFKFGGLDIDRLHKAIEDRENMYSPRANGRTTAIMSLMVGEAQLGDRGNVYMYVGETQNVTKRLAKDFIDILLTEGLDPDFEFSSFGVKVTTDLDKVFWFIGPNQIADVAIGRRFDEIWIDLTPRMFNGIDPRVLDMLEARRRV